MYDSQDQNSGVQYALRFGEIAIHKGFITLNELEEALAEQISTDPSVRLRPRKLIGEILFEKGYMNINQIENVLEEIFKNQHF
jgi:hypothetical protein